MNLLKLISLVVAAALFVPAIAQTSATSKEQASDSDSMNMQILRDKVKADKRLAVAQNMELTDSEAKSFWPIYESYQADLAKINERMKQVIITYADAYRAGAVPNETALKLLQESLATQDAEAQLARSYVPKLEKALPEWKVARYIQIETKIRALVRYELAAAIPLVQ